MKLLHPWLISAGMFYPKLRELISRYRLAYSDRVVEIPNNKLVPEFNRNYNNAAEENIRYTRAGRPYFVPVGFDGTAIKCFEGDWRFDNWPLVFHGTNPAIFTNIILDGFKLPSELGGVRPGHIPLERVVNNVPNWANAIFTSPSYKYATYYGTYCYKYDAQGWQRVWPSFDAVRHANIYVPTSIFNINERGQVVGLTVLLLQCRVNVPPAPACIYAETIGATRTAKIIDNHFRNDELEWRIPNTNDIVAYRILKKEVSIEQVRAGTFGFTQQ